jgi:hypothetical protein
VCTTFTDSLYVRKMLCNLDILFIAYVPILVNFMQLYIISSSGNIGIRKDG